MDLPMEDRTRAINIADLDKLRAEAERSQSVTAPVGKESPWEDDESTRAVASDSAAQWFAMVAGSQVGPMAAPEFTVRAARGEIELATFVWKDGMAEWKQASEVPELAVILTKSNLDNSPPVPDVAKAVSPAAQRKVSSVAAAPAANSSKKSVSSAPLGADPLFDDAAAALFPHPAQKGGPPAGVADLFNDVDMPEGEATVVKTFKEPPPPSATSRATSAPAPVRTAPTAAPFDPSDPFASVPPLAKDRMIPAEENTGSVIARAGVRRRNTFGKVATFLLLLISLPVAGAYALHELQIVPVELTRVDAEGNEVKQPVFSEQGVAALRGMLLGEELPSAGATRKKPAQVAVAAAPAMRASGSPYDVPRPPDLQPKTVASSAELKALYEERKDVAPTARSATGGSVSVASAAGPGEVSVARVVETSKPSFQRCIERQLRANKRFRGGKVNITVTVGTSGKVVKAAVDRRDVKRSPLGQCLVASAKRLVFAPFSGEAVDVEIPLILTTSM